MKSSTILLIAALCTLGQATWPPALSASKSATQSYYDFQLLGSIRTLPSTPTANSPTSHTTAVASYSSNPSSDPTAAVTPLSGPSSAGASSSRRLHSTISIVGEDNNVKSHTVTEDNTRMVTATVTEYDTSCMEPSPTGWGRPTRPHPSTPVDTSKEPDDDYTEHKVAIRDANIPWPPPPGCVNYCEAGRGCWTACDKPTKAPRVCPEGYPCQMKKKPRPKATPKPPGKVPPTVQPTSVSRRPVAQPPPPTSLSTSAPAADGPAPSPALPDPAAPSHHHPHGEHPCPHPESNETSWKPDPETGTATTAEVMLCMPAAAMYVMVAPFVGLLKA